MNTALFNQSGNRWQSLVKLLITACALVAMEMALALVGNPMRFERLGMSEGLSQNTVMVIHQDKTGFLWLGTENGLNRYDGYSFNHYKRDTSATNSLSSDFIWDIDEDADGNLWIGTKGGGLARWNADKDDFTVYRHDENTPNSISHDVIRAVHYTPDGSVWLGTKGAGLDRLDPETGKIENFRHDPKDGNSVGGDNVFALMYDSRGILWIGTNNGMSRFDPITRTFETFRHEAKNTDSVSSNQIRKIYEDRQGNIWVGTRNSGLNLFDRENDTFKRFEHDAEDPATISNNGVRSIFEDDAGRLWIGTNKGLNLFEVNKNRFYHYVHELSDTGSLSDSYIMSMFQDRSGNFWVGTRSKGANKWNPRSWGFGHFSPSRLSHGNVTSFAVDRDKTLWVGTFGGGLNRIDRQSGEVVAIQKGQKEPFEISDNRIMSMLVDSTNQLWLGNMVGGLDRVNLDSGEVTNFHHDPESPDVGLSNNGIVALMEDRNGNIWVGTFGGGLNRISPDGSITRFPYKPESEEGISSGRVLVLAEDKLGNIWVGTENSGLTIFEISTGEYHHFRHDRENPGSLSSDTVYALHLDINGFMWLGTQGGGLTRAVGSFELLEKLYFRSFEPKNGVIINNVVYGIESDTRGELWLSTNYGLTQFSPVTGEARTFHGSHGLQDEEYNFGAHYRSASGKLFFGGANGFNSFYPSDLKINNKPPDVVLTQISLLNKPVQTEQPHWLTDALEISYQDDVLSIEFSALDYAAPRQNRFAYMLEGFDPEWIEAGTKHHVTYTNLDSGEYQFLVRAANSDGVWQAPQKKMSVVSIPPPWKSSIAYTIYCMAGFGVLVLFWLAHQRRLKKEAQFRRRLEQDVQERTRELAERNGELNQLNQRFLQASLTDPLTGLRNRRFVFEEIAKDIDVVRRRHQDSGQRAGEINQSDFIFMMIDLDNFKPVNDTCGHTAGDEMLLQIKDLLLTVCRSSDFVIRWGGDEFLVIGRYSDLSQGEALAERIRARMAESVFSVANGQATRTTCSIGLTGYPFTPEKPDLLDWEQLLSLADSAMYRAKTQRNAWVSIVATENSHSVVNPFYSFRDHTDVMVQQGAIEIHSSFDEQEVKVAEG